MTPPADITFRLDAYLRTCADRPFAWGTHDCCTFGADWVALLTGVQVHPDREYNDALGAYRKLSARAPDIWHLVEAYAKTYGWQPLGQLETGAVTLLPTEHTHFRHAVAIAMGRNRCAWLHKDGVLLADLDPQTLCYRIPCPPQAHS